MADLGEKAQAQASQPRGLARTIWVLEHAQDYVASVVGVGLILLAAVLIVSGFYTFVHELLTKKMVLTAVTGLLDRLLLVLIVAEIVHTVVLSLRTHQLSAQPFIVVGLIAVIRKILLVLSSSNQATVSSTELWLLIAMVVAFVGGLIAVSRFEKKEE